MVVVGVGWGGYLRWLGIVEYMELRGFVCMCVYVSAAPASITENYNKITFDYKSCSIVIALL